MDIFSKRPVFLSCMLFLAFSVAGYFLGGNIKLIILIIAAAALVFSLILALFRYHSNKKKNAFLTLILCLVMIVISLGSSLNYYDAAYEKYAKIYGTENLLEASVTSVDYENTFASTYDIHVNAINGEIDEFDAILECEYSGALRVGDIIEIGRAHV